MEKITQRETAEIFFCIWHDITGWWVACTGKWQNVQKNVVGKWKERDDLESLSITWERNIKI
jgi:hypothetical protein